MNVDEVLRQLEFEELPREAALWALDHWEEASPRLISKLRALARRGSHENSENYSLEYIIHLCAEKRDARAYAPLCELIANDSHLTALLSPDEALVGILINLCDGDVEPLKRAIESPIGDVFCRCDALTALAYLVRERQVLSDDEMRGYLAHLRETMEPRKGSHLWSAWALAVGRLGYEPMRAEVGRLFSRGWIFNSELELDEFHGELRMSRRDPDGLAAFREDGIGPSGSTIETFGPRPEAEVADDDSESVSDRSDAAFAESAAPLINPHRDVGRNDPCVCGSGKKYKKCCLRA